MNHGPILKEKCFAQRKLDEMAEGKMDKYFAITHDLTMRLGEKYKIKLKYGKPSGMK